MSRSKSRVRFLLLSGASLALFSPAILAQETPDQPAEDEARQTTVVVRGQFIPDEKRSTSEVSSLLDASDFAVQGDGDAAAALARVAGISTAQDRFVYVRGLNERYSSATLNGSPLPSPEPLRRVAPLDLFPTSVLESILVQKTFSPNLPAEFGGGLVDIRTKAVPDERFLEVKFGVGGDTETSFKDGLLFDGSDTDWLGYDDGARDLPTIGDAGTDAAFGRALTDNSSLLVVQEGPVGVDASVGVTGGERFDVNDDLSIGLLGSVSYANEWSSRIGKRGFADLDGDGLAQRFDDTRTSTANTVNVNGYGSIGFDILDNHELRFTGLITRSTEKEARTVEGIGFNSELPEREDSLEYFERQLWTTQVAGEHFFPDLWDLKVEWRASYSEAYRDAPYQFQVRYLDRGQGLQTISNAADNTFSFSRIDDDSTDFGIDLELPLASSNGDCVFFCETDLKVGYSYVENDRVAETRIFAIEGVPVSDRRIDFVYASVFANPNARVDSVGGNTFPEAYRATLEVDAGYFAIDSQITPFLRAAIGGRYESAIEAVDTFSFGADPELNFVEACVERQADQSCEPKEDFLPAITITWNPIEDLQVRAGYSETITRPQFRELAPTEFVNTETDVNFLGNPFLVNASIKNWDARAEYYFARGQFLTLGLFYKDMERPIEEINERTADTPKTTFINVPSAILFGAEIEYEQDLPVRDWLEFDWFQSKDFTVKANYTWSDSEVDAGRDPRDLNLSSAEFCAQFADECVTTNQQPLNPTPFLLPGRGLIEDGRRLQGQSEHLFNFQFGFEDSDARSEANLLVNFASERIRSGEALALGIPAILEQPPVTVDFVYNRSFGLYGGDYEFSFNVKNLFGEPYEAYQERGGDRIDVDTYDLGTAFSVGLKRVF